MLEKDSGEILVFGKDNIKHENSIKQNIGVVFDTIFYVDSWTVKDTEKAVSIFYDNWKHDIFNEMIRRFDLPHGKKVRDLSRGMQMKLMLACAFSHDAKLLILDEPTSGLDPVTRDEFLEILQEYIKDGERSVLFSTHITTDLERVADYITLVNQGNMIYTGSMEDLLSSFRLIKGKLRDLTEELEKNILGLRKTDMGFEGLISASEAIKYKDCIIDYATIDNIIIGVSKGGQSDDRLFKNDKTGFFHNEITVCRIFIVDSHDFTVWVYGFDPFAICLICCASIIHNSRYEHVGVKKDFSHRPSTSSRTSRHKAIISSSDVSPAFSASPSISFCNVSIAKIAGFIMMTRLFSYIRATRSPVDKFILFLISIGKVI